MPFLVEAAKTWLGSYADDNDFWVDHRIGCRVCVWIEKVLLQAPALLDTDNALRADVDRLLAALISLGVAEAKRLEEALAETVEPRR